MILAVAIYIGILLIPPQPPPKALEGLDKNSVHVLWYGGVASYFPDVLGEPSFAVISANKLSGGLVYRAWLSQEENGQKVSAYAGEFSRQLGNFPVQTLMFEAWGKRFILGVVEPQVPGNLLYAGFERRILDTEKDVRGKVLIDTIKEGRVHERNFFVLIEPEEFSHWERIASAYVQSEESLDRFNNGPKNNSSAEASIKYSPDKDISQYFVKPILR